MDLSDGKAQDWSPAPEYKTCASGGLSIENQVQISMTENGDPYENALAERMNRTFKEEFGLGCLLPTRSLAYQLTAEAIELYNKRRPHLSLKMETPEKIHLQKIPAIEVTGIL